MRLPITLFTLLSLPAVSLACPESLSFNKRELAGENVVDLCQAYAGKVVLVVNTASKCGYTYQYEGLESIYRKYRDDGFVVLGFPSNDFAGQEPGNELQIQNFCRNTYSIEFPMFEKSRVREGVAEPLYKTLAELSGEYPKWNFHKYLLDRDGNLAGSFSSRVEPESFEIKQAIEKLL